MGTSLMVSGLVVLSICLVLATPGGATGFRPSSHSKVRAEPLPVAPPTNVKFDVKVERFSAVHPKRSTINMTEIYEHHKQKLAQRALCEPNDQEQECGKVQLFPLPACMTCPKPAFIASGQPQDIVNYYSADYFRSVTRASRTDLRDTCIFYSRTYYPAGFFPASYSKVATQVACQYNKYSIWHLWPNRNTEKISSAYLNFYGIFDPDNRLYRISQLGKIANTNTDWYRLYFQHMSTAMAQMCTGQIYVLTQTPENLAVYNNLALRPNIWNDQELAALRSHLQELNTNLIAIDATALPTVKAYKIQWTDLVSQGSTTFPKRTVLEPYNMTDELVFGPWTEKRAELCADSGIGDEPDGIYFFD